MAALTDALTSRRTEGATLAACRRAMKRPPPLPIALRIAAEAARALHDVHEARSVVHGALGPDAIVLGADGNVTLAGFGGALVPAYAAPEQVAGGAVDRRADVFALGVVLWELLAGDRLFDEAITPSARAARAAEDVPDVRADNPLLPDAVAGVVSAAVARDPAMRFATAASFARALDAAREEGRIAAAGEEELALWVNQALSRGDSGAPASGARPSAPAALDVPDLAVPVAPARAAPPSAPAIPAAARPPPTPTPALDELDMEIERGLAPASIATAVSSRSGSRGTPGAAFAPARASLANASGLELAAARSHLHARRDEPDEPSASARAVAWAASLVVLGGTTAVLVRFAHHAGGRSVAAILPRAFDGTSAAQSGGVSLGTLALAVALGFAGVKLTPRSWSLVGSAAALLVLALAMVTVTLASTGENATPPDGVLLLPYLVPAVLATLALALGGRGAVRFAQDGAAPKATAIPLAAIGGALLFLAYETSKLAAP